MQEIFGDCPPRLWRDLSRGPAAGDQAPGCAERGGRRAAVAERSRRDTLSRR